MTRPAGIHTTPISLRIGSDDLAYLRLLHPSGWQTKVKELIHAYVVQCQADGEATLQSLERMYSAEPKCNCEQGHDRPYWDCPKHGHVVVDP